VITIRRKEWVSWITSWLKTTRIQKKNT